mgnify:CR=1 FL=1
MNQAAKTVSDALLGLDFMNVEIGGMVYTIKPPTIKIICRAIHHFSNIGMTGDNVMEAIKELPEATEDMLVFHASSAGMIVWSKNWRTALLKKSKMPWKSVSL